jgi:hypothetical protein
MTTKCFFNASFGLKRTDICLLSISNAKELKRTYQKIFVFISKFCMCGFGFSIFS